MSPPVLLFLSSQIFLSILWWLYIEHQLRLVQLSLWCSTVFQFSSKVLVLILLFAFFKLYSVVSWNSKVHNSASYLVFVDYYKVRSSGRDWVIRLYLKIQEELLRLIFQDRFWVVYQPFVRMVNLNFLHNSQWLPTQLCLVLYYFYANLLHSLIMW